MSGYTHLPKLVARFEERFGRAPTVAARAPGRVNLIGEHTDYNDGWVLPAAVELEVDVVASPREDGRVRLLAADLDRLGEFELGDSRPPEDLWMRYPQGVAVMLGRDGRRLSGMDTAYTGDVPIGSGLSSSAAVEVAFGNAFAAVSGLDIPPEEIAMAAHHAENDFVGVPTGVMDQFISALGRAGHALLLDCRTLEHRHIPINLPGVSMVIVDTNVRRELAGSEYRNRRADCEEAVRRLRQRLHGVRALRDVSPEQLEASADLLDDVRARRARHVVTENARTLEAARALEAGDARRVGELMYASHESLRDLYEVSSPELDAVVEIASSVPGVIGARMTGAGFGGCAVALVEDGAVEALRGRIEAEYPARAGRRADVYVSKPVEGAGATVLGTE